MVTNDYKKNLIIMPLLIVLSVFLGIIYFHPKANAASIYDFQTENTTGAPICNQGDFTTPGSYPVSLTNKQYNCTTKETDTPLFNPDGTPKMYGGQQQVDKSYKADVTETATGNMNLNMSFDVPFAGYLASSYIPADPGANQNLAPLPLQNETPNIGQLIKKVSTFTKLDLSDFQDYLNFLMLPNHPIDTYGVNPNDAVAVKAYDDAKINNWVSRYDGTLTFDLTINGTGSTVKSVQSTQPIGLNAPAFKGVLALYAMSALVSDPNQTFDPKWYDDVLKSPSWDPNGSTKFENLFSKNSYPYTETLQNVPPEDQALCKSPTAAAGDDLVSTVKSMPISFPVQCSAEYNGQCSNNGMGNGDPCSGYSVVSIAPINMRFEGLDNMLGQAWLSEASNNTNSSPICHITDKIIQSHLNINIPDSKQTFLHFFTVSNPIQALKTFDFPWVGNILDINSHTSADMFNTTQPDPLNNSQSTSAFNEQYCAIGKCDCMAYYLANTTPPALDKNDPVVAKAVQSCDPSACNSTFTPVNNFTGDIFLPPITPDTNNNPNYIAVKGNYACNAVSSPLQDYLKQVSSWTGTPASVIAAGLNRETGGRTNLNPYSVVVLDTPTDNPNCPVVHGVMQFCKDTWNGIVDPNMQVFDKYLCNNPQRQQIPVSCPSYNVVSDVILAAAIKMAQDHGATWDQSGVNNVASRYCGAPCSISVSQCRSDPSVKGYCTACVGDSDLTYCQAYDFCASAYSSKYFNDITLPSSSP